MNDYYFEAQDGLKLCYKKNVPSNAKHIVLFSHGAGEYPDRYNDFFHLLRDNEIGFYAIHHRGFGKSEGRRGHVSKFSQYIEDLRELYRIASKQGNIPDILFGHSMGGLIAAYFCLEYPGHIRKLILSSPAFRMEKKISLWVNLAKKPMSFIWPTFTRDSGLKSDLGDELFVSVGTARWLVEFERAQKYVLRNASKLSLPIYIFHPKFDDLASFAETKKFFHLIGSNKKVLKEESFKGHHFLSATTPEEKLSIQKQIITWINN